MSGGTAPLSKALPGSPGKEALRGVAEDDVGHAHGWVDKLVGSKRRNRERLYGWESDWVSERDREGTGGAGCAGIYEVEDVF